MMDLSVFYVMVKTRVSPILWVECRVSLVIGGKFIFEHDSRYLLYLQPCMQPE